VADGVAVLRGDAVRARRRAAREALRRGVVRTARGNLERPSDGTARTMVERVRDLHVAAGRVVRIAGHRRGGAGQRRGGAGKRAAPAARERETESAEEHHPESEDTMGSVHPDEPPGSNRSVEEGSARGSGPVHPSRTQTGGRGGVLMNSAQGPPGPTGPPGGGGPPSSPGGGGGGSPIQPPGPGGPLCGGGPNPGRRRSLR